MKVLSKFLQGTVLFSVLLMSACYPLDPETYSDLDVVITGRTDFDFGNPAIKTYFMADTIVDLSEPGNSPPSINNPNQIKDDIVRNMNAFGYKQILDQDSAKDADFIVLISVNRSNNYYYSYW